MNETNDDRKEGIEKSAFFIGYVMAILVAVTISVSVVVLFLALMFRFVNMILGA